jgi:hypothetical protein
MGRMVAMILPYVTLHPLGTLSLVMKKQVLVPEGIRVLTPWASHPSSLAKDWSQISKSGPSMRCLYSCTLPVVALVTELAL